MNNVAKTVRELCRATTDDARIAELRRGYKRLLPIGTIISGTSGKKGWQEIAITEKHHQRMENPDLGPQIVRAMLDWEVRPPSWWTDEDQRKLLAYSINERLVTLRSERERLLEELGTLALNNLIDLRRAWGSRDEKQQAEEDSDRQEKLEQRIKWIGIEAFDLGMELEFLA